MKILAWLLVTYVLGGTMKALATEIQYHRGRRRINNGNARPDDERFVSGHIEHGAQMVICMSFLLWWYLVAIRARETFRRWQRRRNA